MGSAEYLNLINSYDIKIQEKEREIIKLEREIVEAEDAVEGAIRLKNDFNDFVERKRQRNKYQEKWSAVKAFSSFISHANNLLCGHEFNRANEQVEEINIRIRNDLEMLRDDLRCCRSELNQLRRKRAEMYNEYQRCLKSEQEGEVV